MTSPLFFPTSVSQILVQAKLESYLTFPLGLLNLLDRDRACDTIPNSEREKGVLPVIIVSQNKTLRFGKKRLQTPSPSLEASPPGHWSQLARLCSEQRPSAVPSC